MIHSHLRRKESSEKAAGAKYHMKKYHFNCLNVREEIHLQCFFFVYDLWDMSDCISVCGFERKLKIEGQEVI